MSRDRLGAGGFDRLVDGGSDFVFVKLFWQELFDNADFRVFLFGELKPAAFFVGARAFLALLDHLAKDLQHLGIADTAFVTVAPHGDVAVLDGGVDQAQCRQARHVLGLHRGFQRVVDAGAHIH